MLRQRMLSIVLGVLAVVMTPVVALAQDNRLDAKLEGYATNVKADPASTAVTWIMVVLMALVCLAVLFKDAKRTHLD